MYRMAQPKQISGHAVTGAMFLTLARAYVKAINEGAVPNIQSAWQSVGYHIFVIRPTLGYHIISDHIRSYHIRSYHILCNHIISYHIIYIISCHVLSCQS